MNSLDQDVRVTVGGNTFDFSPLQIKYFYNEDIAQLIARNRGETGLIELPQELEYLGHIKLKPSQKIEEILEDPSHLKILQEKREQGVNNYVTDLRRKVYNAQVSLARDIARANYKHDVKYEYSDGDLKNMENLAKYQNKKEDTTQSRFDRAKELEKKLLESSRS